MQSSTMRFNDQDRPEFYKTLRKRVNQYFKDEEISRFANGTMVFKSFFMLSLYFVPFALMLFGVIESVWLVFGMWVLMGLGMSGIGLSIMHDANHGAYSSNENVNKFFGFTLNFIGGYHVNWKIQHNVLHHSFTNIDGYDEDIDKNGIIRFSPTQKHKSAYKFQLFYAPFLYSILTLFWVTVKDYEQLFNYNKRELLKSQGVTFGQALLRIVVFKTIYFGFTIVLPIMVTDIPWWAIVLGFVLMHAVCGLILALVFQSAHVLEETEFYMPEELQDVENHWAIHQMKTTANFSVGNVPLTWFIGGLNHQVEHHLFPTICHVHYPALSKIVRATAEEFDVPYNEHKTFAKALGSHFRLLNDLGTGKYDRMHA